MKRELIIAMMFCTAGMTISFVPILYKNNWIVFNNGHEVNLLESK